MKNALLRIITTALVLVAVGSAQTAAPVVTDLWAIEARVEELKPKDAFETTSQYNARLASAFQLPETLNIGVGSNGVKFRYDADGSVLLVALKTSGTSVTIINTLPERSGSLDYLRPGNSLIPERYLECEYKIKSSRKYMASNSYGKEVEVSETVAVEIGLPLYGSRWHVTYPDSYNLDDIDRASEVDVFRLNMDPATAKETLPHLHVVVNGLARNTPFLRATYAKEAKIDNPTSLLAYTYLIPVDIAQVLLIDDRTSTVVATTPLQQPTRSPAQATTTQTSLASSNEAPIDYRAKVGISFSEWLTFNSINLTELCRVNYGACEKLTKIQKSGKGQFWTEDQYGKTIAWSFKSGKVTDVR